MKMAKKKGKLNWFGILNAGLYFFMFILIGNTDKLEFNHQMICLVILCVAIPIQKWEFWEEEKNAIRR